MEVHSAIWLYRDNVRCPVCKGKFKPVDLEGFKYPGVEIPKPFLMFMWFAKGGPNCCSKECAKHWQAEATSPEKSKSMS
jgi:hypothetical protein